MAIKKDVGTTPTKCEKENTCTDQKLTYRGLNAIANASERRTQVSKTVASTVTVN